MNSAHIPIGTVGCIGVSLLRSALVLQYEKRFVCKRLLRHCFLPGLFELDMCGFELREQVLHLVQLGRVRFACALDVVCIFDQIIE